MTRDIATEARDIQQALGGRSMIERFAATAAACSSAVALRSKNGDGWDEFTFAEVADQIQRAATWLAGVGIARGDRVVLMTRNIPQFHIADLAVLAVGATPVSIYNSSSPEQIAYVLKNTGAALVIAEDCFVPGVVVASDSINGHPRIVVIGDTDIDGADTVAWSTVLNAEPSSWDTINSQSDPGDLATIIYTSGTTGPPKGAKISQQSALFLVESFTRSLGENESLEGTRMISYLPLAHIAERLLGHYLWLANGSEITCCPDLTQLASYLSEVKPQVFFGVPRVWEKFRAAVEAQLHAAGKATEFAGAVEAATPLAQAKADGTATGEQLAALAQIDQSAFAPIRGSLGLDECRYAFTAAAPMAPDLYAWLSAIGIPMSELFGMTEACGAITWSPHQPRPGSVGQAMPGCELRIADDGELLCRGPYVFAGYLDDPERTAEVLDADGWLLTGDIATVDGDGYYTIVDRKKEIIITAGGKNISPANLEAVIKGVDVIEHAVAIGDRRPFVSALIVLDPEATKRWANEHEIDGDLQTVAKHPELVGYVEGSIASAMDAFSQVERVKKISIISDTWQPDSDVLTPTMKLKRRGVNKRYASVIEAMYL